jgi:hypothetical protein
MSQPKTMWFEVQENETIEDCLKRMAAEGYEVAGRREEPIFKEVNGKIIPVHQRIQFKGKK